MHPFNNWSCCTWVDVYLSLAVYMFDNYRYLKLNVAPQFFRVWTLNMTSVMNVAHQEVIAPLTTETSTLNFYVLFLQLTDLPAKSCL